jgi:integrase
MGQLGRIRRQMGGKHPPKSSPSPPLSGHLDLDMSTLEEIIERSKQKLLSEQDCQLLRSVVETLHVLTQELEKKHVSIQKLKQMLFGATTESTRNRRINPRRLDAMELLPHPPKHRRLPINLFFSRLPKAHEHLRQLDGETYEQWQKRLTRKEKAELKAWYKQYHWHPHQLRHNAATFLRKEFGLDTARVILGHRSAAITEVYAELDQQKALDAIVRAG